jgi:HPt (histidine-containing phosphotransfer) domain-containing protein
MAYDPGALQTALAAAVGDDPALIAELRFAFLASAHAHADSLGRANGDADWQKAACRLQSHAASLGATRLTELAGEAVESAPGDPTVLRRIDRAIAMFSDDSIIG